MADIKTLYSFTVEIEKQVDKVESVTVDGQTYDKKVKVTEKTPIKFALKKPSRREFEDARLFYGIEQNKAITNGFLTKGMMVNKYANTTGGIFSQNEAKELLSLFRQRESLDAELKQAASISAPEDVQNDLKSRLLAISRQILEIELSNQSLFQHTAENHAKEKTIAYMVYCFTYIDKNGKFVPYFEGDDEDPVKRFQLRQAQHFALEDKEDTLLLLVRDRLINLFAHYYEGVAVTEEDFKNIEVELKNQFTPKEEAGTIVPLP